MDNEEIAAKARLAADFMTIALVGLITLCFELPDTMRYLASPDAAIVGDVLGAMKR